MNEQYISSNTMEDDLTIYFRPSFTGIDSIERDWSRNSVYNLTEYLRGLHGAYHYGYYNSLRGGNFEEQMPLKVKFEDRDCEIGHYLPLRNVVLIYLPIKDNWEVGLKNKYVLRILDYVKEIVERYNIKSVDVTEAKEKILIGKFTRAVNEEISSWVGKIDGANRDRIVLEKKIIDCYRTVKLGNGSLIGLRVFVNQIKEGLLEKIKEIKDLKFVKSAELTKEGIELKFNEVFIKVKEEDIRMGNYTVTLLPNSMKIVNDKPIERHGEMYHSPHIQGDTICFGQQNNVAYKLLGNLEFKKLAHFLWLYLNSYNQGDTYIPMRDWIAGRNNGDVVPTTNDDEDEEEQGGFF